MSHLRLGVNIDHIATLRNARGENYPDPVAGALIACDAGADGITVHLREDRRHIRDNDVVMLQKILSQRGSPLNLEIAATAQMQRIACEICPHALCIVPEKRQELTTEGGLDASGQKKLLQDFLAPLQKYPMRISLFIDPEEKQVRAAQEVGADAVEFHTGRYAAAQGAQKQYELEKIRNAVELAAQIGLECHAGHGLTYDNTGAIAAIGKIVELNIGHFLIAQAVLTGLAPAIAEMRRIMDEARKNDSQADSRANG